MHPGTGRASPTTVMANGERMNPRANVAASKTLPLGTTAEVTNLRNGNSATVQIEDRGPFVDGRVVDVSPKVANEIGLKKHGVAPVVVKPIAVPQPNGEVKLGAGAADATPQQIRQATQTTKATGGPAGDRDREQRAEATRPGLIRPPVSSRPRPARASVSSWPCPGDLRRRIGTPRNRTARRNMLGRAMRGTTPAAAPCVLCRRTSKPSPA